MSTFYWYATVPLFTKFTYRKVRVDQRVFCLFVFFTQDNHRLVTQWLKKKMQSKYAVNSNSHKWPVLL